MVVANYLVLGKENEPCPRLPRPPAGTPASRTNTAIWRSPVFSSREAAGTRSKISS
jgi:hypothetical protein